MERAKSINGITALDQFVEALGGVEIVISNKLPLRCGWLPITSFIDYCHNSTALITDGPGACSPMIHKMPSSRPEHTQVTFELPSSLWADRVYVVGNFNHWSQTTTPLTQARDGIWRATVELFEGQQYQFRYLINGTWTADFQADGFVGGEGIPYSLINLL